VNDDVPYARLLDCSPKTNKIGGKDAHPTPKAINVFTPKTSASDSRLTVEYFQPEELVARGESPAEIMSQSAPQSNPNPMQESDSDSLSPKLTDDTVMRDVQRTISLTSENPSEAFFSADEDIHASRSSSLKTSDVPYVPKKRFASDLSIVANEMEGKLSTHRSDYEIHTPEHRSLPVRPQSTAELVSFLSHMLACLK
jgi:hypothetical protein